MFQLKFEDIGYLSRKNDLKRWDLLKRIYNGNIKMFLRQNNL